MRIHFILLKLLTYTFLIMGLSNGFSLLSLGFLVLWGFSKYELQAERKYREALLKTYDITLNNNPAYNALDRLYISSKYEYNLGLVNELRYVDVRGPKDA